MMDTKLQERLAVIEKRLEQPLRNAHAASYLAREIFEFQCELGGSDIPDFGPDLCYRYIEKLGDRAEGYASSLVAYAIRLINSGELLYEEWHKLFSLRDNIQCMKLVGINVDCVGLDSAFWGRIENDRSMAKMVAEDKVKGWNAEWEWYKRLI